MRRSGPKNRRRLKPSSPPAAGLGLRVPFVAIVGRPNVGKSTLFNRLMGRRISIVEKTAGTTRDRVSAILELPDGRRVELCDMGGLGGTDDPLDRDVDRQIRAAMSMADTVVLVCDARSGPTPLDRDIAQRMLRLRKPIIVVANKAETRELSDQASELVVLGAGEPLAISAREGTGRLDLLERLAAIVPAVDAERDTDAGPAAADPDGADAPEEQRELRVAIVGRRNAGKSSYVNALFGAERVIVSATPGTTRDAVDVRCLVDGEPIVLIDTAGLRKRGKADDQIEIISHSRAMEAVRRADVAIVLLDSLRDVSEVDKKICELVTSEYKGLVVVASKWDLTLDRMTIDQFAEYVRKKMPSISYAPVAAISAQTGFNVKAPVELARDLHRQSHARVTTGPLNRALHEAFARRRPRKKRHVEAKIYFGTQIRVNPVTLVVFVNKPALFDADYQRYLQSELRAVLPWGEVPIKLVIRERRGLLEKGLGRAERERRQLEKTRRWLANEDSVPAEEVAAELDSDPVRRALALELEAEEREERRAGAVPGRLPGDDVSYEDEPLPEAGDDDEPPAREAPRDLLYGQDAELVRRRRKRQQRRGRGRGGPQPT